MKGAMKDVNRAEDANRAANADVDKKKNCETAERKKRKQIRRECGDLNGRPDGKAKDQDTGGRLKMRVESAVSGAGCR